MHETTYWIKKPIKVRATKWTGHLNTQMLDLLAGQNWLVDGPEHGNSLHVTTVDGNRVAIPVGAYLVLDAKGLPYPCDAEIFLNGHEPADA